MGCVQTKQKPKSLKFKQNKVDKRSISSKISLKDVSTDLSNPTNDAERFFEEANQKMNSGNYSEAIIGYQYAIRRDEELHEAYQQMWKAILKLQKFDETVEYCHNLLEKNMENKFAYNLLGNALAEKKEFDVAIQCYHRVI